MTEERGELDGPWKDAVAQLLPDFLALLFADIHERLDFARGYEDLDTELRQLIGESETGGMRADLLLRVWDKTGAWHPLHIEIQGQAEAIFEARMYGYGTRIRDRYGRELASLAVLADERPSWRPDEFRAELWGTARVFRFRAEKALDWEARRAELESSPNPFAAVLLAHLAMQRTKQVRECRLEEKRRLIFSLYDKGWTPTVQWSVLRVVDWFLKLPLELAARFRKDLQRFEEDRKMPYITSFELLARHEGKVEGSLGQARTSVIDVLEARFGAEARALTELIEAIDDPTRLKALLARAALAPSLSVFQQALTAAP